MEQSRPAPLVHQRRTNSAPAVALKIAVWHVSARCVPHHCREITIMQIQPEKLVVGIQHREDIVPLTEDEVRFEIDMCIGCDRCMRACPVPLSSMVNIADLNLATISDVVAPHVARFTDECVMCGSCVPVCPVNNHRDLLMLSLKQRLGIPWDGKVDMSRVLDHLPPGWDIQLLLSRLREQPMFSDPQVVPGQQRNATARAQTAAVVLEVPEQVMQRLIEIVPPVRTFFERLNNARSIESVMKRMAIFQGIADPDIRWIANKIQFKNFDRDEQLFTESDKGQPARESLHIIMEGFVKVARRTTAGTGHHKTGERIIAYRQGGDYFAGGLDMLGDGRAVTVTAINRVHVAEVPRQKMLTILARYPEHNQRFTTPLQEYRVAAVAAESFIGSMEFLRAAPAQSDADAEARAGLRALVGGADVEGTEVLVIDLDKCVHCDKGEDACARPHGHSRINRKGRAVGTISIAPASRHCQIPPCMLAPAP